MKEKNETYNVHRKKVVAYIEIYDPDFFKGVTKSNFLSTFLDIPGIGLGKGKYGRNNQFVL